MPIPFLRGPLKLQTKRTSRLFAHCKISKSYLIQYYPILSHLQKRKIGTINYEGSVRIDGRFHGEIHTEGTLLVGQQAVITATISAGTVINKGQITGDVLATEKVLLLATANMDGSLNTPQLSMEEGVVFNGTLEMEQSATS